MSWAPNRLREALAAEVPEAFGQQFSWQDGGYRYRRNGVGPALPVETHELEDFCARYIRWSRRMAFVVVLTVVGVLGGALALSEPDAWYADWLLGGLVVALMIGFAALYDWARTAPARALAGRQPVAPALTRQEIRHRRLKGTRLWHLLAWFPAALIGTYTFTDGYRTFTPWSITVVLACVGLAVMYIREAIDKWRFDKAERAATVSKE